MCVTVLVILLCAALCFAKKGERCRLDVVDDAMIVGTSALMSSIFFDNRQIVWVSNKMLLGEV